MLVQIIAATGWKMEQLEQAVLVIAKVIMDGAKVAAIAMPTFHIGKY